MFSSLALMDLKQRKQYLMAYRLMCVTCAILFYISSGAYSSVNMCESGTTRINDIYLELYAIGPSSISPLTTDISTTCSCFISTASFSNIVNVKISRNAEGPNCAQNEYDKATLDFITHSQTIQNDELSDFSKRYENISTMWSNITIHSICSSNYTIGLQLTQMWLRRDRFSSVTCYNPKIVVTSSSTTASTTALKPTDVSKNDISSTYSPKDSSSAGSVIEENASAPSQKGLIVGVVVGVGGGLLLLGAIILAVFIFRRRRAKPQPLTNANQNAPTENPYELPIPPVPVVYETLNPSLSFRQE